MAAREILSLQFGHYANFVGTHWWNIQESSFDYKSAAPSEINHDVLFRKGLTKQGDVTYTPRLLLADLKGSLKSLSDYGALYDPPPKPCEIGVVWDGGVEMQTEAPITKNTLQKKVERTQEPDTVLQSNFDLDTEVNVWSDFLYSQFHPRTVNVINEYEHSSNDKQLDVFPLGSSLWKSNRFEEDFSDKIRNYIEECDSFQGFHVTLDGTNGFAGLAASCIEHIRDEYERKSVLAFPVIPSHYPDYLYSNAEQRLQSSIKDAVRTVNLVLCFDSLAEYTSLYSPLCTSAFGWRQPGPKREFYRLVYDSALAYHTSAILAVALDTVTLKYRLRGTQCSLSDLCADLNVHGRKAAATSICLPFSFNKGADFIDCLDRWEGPLTQSITPRCVLGTDKLIQMMTLRGIAEDRLKGSLRRSSQQKEMLAYRCNSVNEMLSLYLSCNYFFGINSVTTASKGISVKTPFPNIFDPFVDVDGNIIANERLEQLKVESVPVMAGLHSGPCIGDMLEKLRVEVVKLKASRFHRFTSAGLESQDLQDSLQRLSDLRECYEENYNS